MAKKNKKKKGSVTPPTSIYLQVGRTYYGEEFHQLVSKSNANPSLNGSLYEYKLVGPVTVKVEAAK